MGSDISSVVQPILYGRFAGVLVIPTPASNDSVQRQDLRIDSQLGQSIESNPAILARRKAPRAYQTQATKALSDKQLAALIKVVGSKAASGELVGKRDYALLLFCSGVLTSFLYMTDFEIAISCGWVYDVFAWRALKFPRKFEQAFYFNTSYDHNKLGPLPREIRQITVGCCYPTALLFYVIESPHACPMVYFRSERDRVLYAALGVDLLRGERNDVVEEFRSLFRLQSRVTVAPERPEQVADFEDEIRADAAALIGRVEEVRHAKEVIKSGHNPTTCKIVP